MKLKIYLVSLLLAATTASRSQSAANAVSSPRISQAIELFKAGPSKGDEVISLLRAELKEHPASLEAHKLLGTAYYLKARFPEAIMEFDWVVKDGFSRKDGSIHVSGKLLLWRAEAIARTGKTRRALDEYTKYWAFSNTDPDDGKVSALLIGLHNLRLCDDTRRILEAHGGVVPAESPLYIPVTTMGLAALGPDAELQPVAGLLAGAKAQDAVFVISNVKSRRWVVLFNDNEPIGVTSLDSSVEKPQYSSLKPLQPVTHLEIAYGDWNTGHVTSDGGQQVDAYQYKSTSRLTSGDGLRSSVPGAKSTPNSNH